MEESSGHYWLSTCACLAVTMASFPRFAGCRLRPSRMGRMWHLELGKALPTTDDYRGSTLVIDLKPKQHKTSVSLYEVLDVWGYSCNGWTPILLHLAGLFVDEDPARVKWMGRSTAFDTVLHAEPHCCDRDHRT